MSSKNKDEMLAEYDFRGTKTDRGKYYQSLREGRKTNIHNSDGSTAIGEVCPIFLDPDIQEKFPDSAVVNQALRELTEIKG